MVDVMSVGDVVVDDVIEESINLEDITIDLDKNKKIEVKI